MADSSILKDENENNKIAQTRKNIRFQGFV